MPTAHQPVQQLTSGRPTPDDVTIIASADIPGGRHVAGFSQDPDDHALYQFLLGDGSEPISADVVATGFDIAREVSSGDLVGIGTFLGSLPESLCFVRSTRDDYRIDIYLTDDEEWPDIEKYALTFYRRVWPGIPHEVELLSTLIGSYSPDLIGRIEFTHEGRSYVLGTLRRLPIGVNAWHRARHDAQAQMYSHSEGVQLGKTLRLIHDSMLMAFGYEWVPTASVARRLSKRLDYFTEGTPSLTPFIPLIRKWYQLPDGEVLVQRVHGNICLEQLWLEEDSWLIGGWEGDIRLPMPERIVPGCSLEDLASLVRSLYWASGGNTAWCTETMRAVTEGYGHPPAVAAAVRLRPRQDLRGDLHRDTPPRRAAGRSPEVPRVLPGLGTGTAAGQPRVGVPAPIVVTHPAAAGRTVPPPARG